MMCCATSKRDVGTYSDDAQRHVRQLADDEDEHNDDQHQRDVFTLQEVPSPCRRAHHDTCAKRNKGPRRRADELTTLRATSATKGRDAVPTSRPRSER